MNHDNFAALPPCSPATIRQSHRKPQRRRVLGGYVSFAVQMATLIPRKIKTILRGPQDDLIDWAWTIIANAGGGDWLRESNDWQKAAAGWREAYHKHLAERKI